MNFLNLYYFLVVAEEKSFTRAAERLHMSQQALSNHILKLEKYFDTPLFYRRHTLSLTYAGIRLLKTATQILELKRQIEMEINDIGENKKGEVRIGITYARGHILLPKLLPAFSEQYPETVVTVHEGNSEKLKGFLFHRQIDMLIDYAPILLDKVRTIEILKERLYLAVPKVFLKQLYGDDLEAKLPELRTGTTVKPFGGLPFILPGRGHRIREMSDQHMIIKCSLMPNIIMESENIETLLSLACQGMGITVCSEMFVKNFNDLLFFGIPQEECPLEFFPIDDPATTSALVIAYYRDSYLSEAAKSFMNAAAELYKKPKAD